MECGTKVRDDETGAADFVAGLTNLLFYISVLALIASPFVDRLPSFTFCILITSALLFISRTAKDCVQKVRKK